MGLSEHQDGIALGPFAEAILGSGMLPQRRHDLIILNAVGHGRHDIGPGLAGVNEIRVITSGCRMDRWSEPLIWDSDKIETPSNVGSVRSIQWNDILTQSGTLYMLLCVLG